MLLGVLFQRRALRHALEAGDLRRSIGALSTYIMLTSASGGRSAKRTARLIERLEYLVRRDGSSSCLQLVRDRPGDAERLLDAALARGPRAPQHLISLSVLLARVSVELYPGQVEAAHQLDGEILARMRRSRLWSLQPTRLLVWQALGSSRSDGLIRAAAPRLARARRAFSRAREAARSRPVLGRPQNRARSAR